MMFEAEYATGWADATPEALAELIRDVYESGNPATALSALGILERWVNDHERELVSRAREADVGWPDIARALGRSRQAVWKMYRKTEGEAPAS